VKREINGERCSRHYSHGEEQCDECGEETGENGVNYHTDQKDGQGE